MAASAALWVGALELMGAAIFAAAGLGEACLRRRSAAARREAWALAIAVALVLPLPRLALAMPDWGATSGLTGALLIAWALGAAVLLVRLVRGHLIAMRQVRRSAALIEGPWLTTLRSLQRADEPPVELRRCEEIRTPQVAGVMRPVILVPTHMLAAPAAERRALLAHELAHVRRADPLLWLAGGLARAIYWPDPLAWWALRRLRAHAEAAADDAALHTGIPSSSYAAQLVAVARDQLERAGRVAADGLRARVRGVLDARRIRSGAPAGMPGFGLSRLVGAALLLATLVTACEARSDDSPRARVVAAR